LRDTRHLSYNAKEFSKEKTKYAVVIPVINEGERFTALLDRMGSIDVFGKFDVIVVDGGSTDGSVEPEHLQLQGINTLLINESGAGLGLQLQCAYDFVLKRSYEGVITIDGNNKDDPTGILRMKKALDEKVDFAQGSRFITGGTHTNTPCVRVAAVRLLHAPLLSLASGFKWTDTTQGFRAYSRRLIEDPGLCIFRRELFDYGFLFYISKTAPHLGMSCVEVPTTRDYPAGVATPTKIVGVLALVRITKSLLLACSGWYRVRNLGAQQSKTIRKIL
jgi:dolichol-phosphate mannosyltransferase